jgi:hypothetical protein
MVIGIIPERRSASSGIRSNVDIPNYTTAYLAAGTVTNVGTINLQSMGNDTELQITGAVTFAGSGNVVMSANSKNYILGNRHIN